MAAELKKNDDDTEGSEDVEPESGLSGKETAGLADDDMKMATCTRGLSPLSLAPRSTQNYFAMSTSCSDCSDRQSPLLSAWGIHITYEARDIFPALS